MDVSHPTTIAVFPEDSRASGLLDALLNGRTGAFDAEVETLLDALAVPVFAKGRDLRYTFVNRAFKTFLGVEASSILGHTAADLVPADQAVNFKDHDRDLIELGGTQHYEAQVAVAGGIVRDVIFHKTAVTGADGKISGIVGVVLDITDQKALRREVVKKNHDLTERMKELRCLYEVSGALAIPYDDTGAMIDAVLPKIPPGWQAQERAEARIVLPGLVRTTPGFVETDRMLSAPIPLSDTEHGRVDVVYAPNQADAAAPDFLPEERALLTELGRKIGRRLETFHDIAALRESEARFRATFDQPAVAICHVALDGRFLRVNDRACTLWRYARAQLEAMNIRDLSHERDLARSETLMQCLLSGETGSFSISTTYRTGDGGTVSARVSVSLVRNGDGHPAYFIVVIEDESDARAARERADELNDRLSRALRGTVDALVNAQEVRDPYTAGHQSRVAELAVAMGRHLGLSPERLQDLEMGARIHDIGKLRVPSDLLTKPGALSDEEFALIKTHSKAGYEILKDTALSTRIADMVLHHHERWDGSGYPDGLAGEEISLEAQIIGVADTLEAVTSHRPYRPSRGLETGLKILDDGRGLQFSSAAVDACHAVLAVGTVAWPGALPAE